MTNADFKKQLATLMPPAPSDEAQARALHRATLAFNQPAATTTDDRFSEARFWRAMPAWAAVALLATVAVCAGTFYFRGSLADAPAVGAVETALADLQTLAQVEGLFPGQLNAVIERDGELQLDLTKGSQPSTAEQPLIVHLEDGGHRLSVLSYSGRSITLELKDGRITFEALVTSEGDVVLAGNNFVWNSAQPGPLAGYRVQARPLHSSL